MNYIWDFSCSPISDKMYVQNLLFLQLLVADCDYAENYGWFLYRGNAKSGESDGIFNSR